MTQKQCRRQFKNIFKKYNNPLQVIAGEYLPGFIEICRNGFFLAGRAIYLSNPYCSIEDEFKKEYNRAHQALKDLICMATWDSEDGIVVGVEQLSAAYLDLLKIELKMGTVRIPCISTQYKSDTKVQSQYNDWKLNYSPILSNVTPMDSLEALAEHFANCLLFDKQCNLITLNFKRGVTEEDLPKIQEMATKMTKCFNKYFIEEFKKKKNDPEYRFRNDCNPADF